MEHVEQVHTNERVSGHENYYEKNGLRTAGDGVDHEHEPKMSFARMMSLIAMAFREYAWHFVSPHVADCSRQFGLDHRSPSISSAASLHTSMETSEVQIAGSGSSSPTCSPWRPSARSLAPSRI